MGAASILFAMGLLAPEVRSLFRKALFRSLLSRAAKASREAAFRSALSIVEGHGA